MSIQENNQGKFHNLGPMNFIVLGFWLIFLIDNWIASYSTVLKCT